MDAFLAGLKTVIDNLGSTVVLPDFHFLACLGYGRKTRTCFPCWRYHWYRFHRYQPGHRPDVGQPVWCWPGHGHQYWHSTGCY